MLATNHRAEPCNNFYTVGVGFRYADDESRAMRTYACVVIASWSLTFIGVAAAQPTVRSVELQCALRKGKLWTESRACPP